MTTLNEYVRNLLSTLNVKVVNCVVKKRPTYVKTVFTFNTPLNDSQKDCLSYIFTNVRLLTKSKVTAEGNTLAFITPLHLYKTVLNS